MSLQSDPNPNPNSSLSRVDLDQHVCRLGLFCGMDHLWNGSVVASLMSSAWGPDEMAVCLVTPRRLFLAWQLWRLDIFHLTLSAGHKRTHSFYFFGNV